MHMRAGVLLHLECIEEGVRPTRPIRKAAGQALRHPRTQRYMQMCLQCTSPCVLNVFGEFQRSRVDNMKKKMEKERERIQEKKRRIVFFLYKLGGRKMRLQKKKNKPKTQTGPEPFIATLSSIMPNPHI